MMLKLIGATRINRSKMHKIVIEMFKIVDINNEVFREELETKSLYWSGHVKVMEKKQGTGECIQILKLGKSFMVLSSERFFFRPGTRKYQ
jgi:hypothetical protein